MPTTDPKQTQNPVVTPPTTPTSTPVNPNPPPPTPAPLPTPPKIDPAFTVVSEANRIDITALKTEIKSGKRSVDFSKIACPVCKSVEHTTAGISSPVFTLVVCTTCWAVYANKILVVSGE